MIATEQISLQMAIDAPLTCHFLQLKISTANLSQIPPTFSTFAFAARKIFAAALHTLKREEQSTYHRYC